MATPYVRGPALFFVKTPGTSTPVFLGTCERTPRIRIKPEWSAVFNDLLGGRIPYDLAFEGEEAYLFCTLTRWNEGVLTTLQARPTTLGTRGSQVSGDIGTLMMTEGAGFGLYCQFPYASKAAYATMPAGYRFPMAILEGPDDLDNCNTEAAKDILVFHALRVPTVQGAGLSTLLYDHNMAGLPAIN